MHKNEFFFASKLSIYFSWIFINLKISANGVTAIFFITGLAGSVLFAFDDFILSLIAYSLWRLHAIFDLCDGEVARFTQKFSINGAYWDYMIHSILYPATYILILFSLYIKFSDVNFLYLGMVGSIIISQTLSVKNNYYRAMLFDGKKLDTTISSNQRSAIRTNILILFTSVLGFEGFIFLYTFSLFFEVNSEIYLIFILLYLIGFFLQSLIKFLLFSKKGFYERKT